MLPEHVKLLREWQAEDQYIVKPALDEVTQQEIGEQLCLAYEHKLQIRLRIVEPTISYELLDYIVKIDVQKQKIHLQHGEILCLQCIYDAMLQE